METAKDIIENLIYDLTSDLINSNEIVVGTIAEANATGFVVNSYEIDADFTDSSKSKIDFGATIEFKGEQDEQGFFYGERISLRVTGTAFKGERDWQVDIEIVECNLKRD